jgi:hypothetical protein
VINKKGSNMLEALFNSIDDVFAGGGEKPEIDFDVR